MQTKILIKKSMDFKSKNYKDLTRFVYQDLSWGPLLEKDGEVISNADNNAEVYKESLDVMNIKVSELKEKTIFNIGTGRKSIFCRKWCKCISCRYCKKFF